MIWGKTQTFIYVDIKRTKTKECVLRKTLIRSIDYVSETGYRAISETPPKKLEEALIRSLTGTGILVARAALLPLPPLLLLPPPALMPLLLLEKEGELTTLLLLPSILRLGEGKQKLAIDDAVASPATSARVAT